MNVFSKRQTVSVQVYVSQKMGEENLRYYDAIGNLTF